MDLVTTSAAPSEKERQALDAVLGAPTSGWFGGERHALDGHVAYGGLARAAGRRHLLLPALRALQDEVGWISPGALGYLCRCVDLPPAEVYGVASAYALLRFEPAAPLVVHVCDDVACRAALGADPTAALVKSAGPRGDGAGNGNGNGAGVTWQPSPCLGHCEHGSAAFVQHPGQGTASVTLAPFAPADLASLASLGADADLSSLPLPLALVPQVQDGVAGLGLLGRVGRVDPTSLDAYRSAGGYEALRRALRLGPSGVIAELKASGLLGRGGAAFPTGLKWEAVATNPARPHYFVANADESEPGTFKDRVLLEHDPFALLEALTVAGITTGAEQGFVYVRGEYPRAAARLEDAAAQARARGLLGQDVMGSGCRFDLEVRRGAGAYVAGEETAMFNSIEGRRPEPRNKPPFPTERGLFSKPTGVNNVETLFSVLEVLTVGADAFAATGTATSTGTRLFCVSGRVERPGLYEVAMGTPLSALLELAGGVRGGRPLRAVLLGGAAGGFVGPDALELPLSFEGARQAGATLGSGVVVVLDDTSDVGALLARVARFFRDESCGQCVPCRVGTQRQEEVLARLAAHRPLGSVRDELALLMDLDAVMRDASICGLGQTASSLVVSALRQGLIEGAGHEGNGREP